MADATTPEPVEYVPAHRRRQPEAGIALCLSGGGYRAMLFHLGALRRLNELGYLDKLDRVSSVSGGSIVAAVLGRAWSKLGFARGVAQHFETEVVAPVRRLASRTVDAGAILGGALLPGTTGGRVVRAYRKHLFGSDTLQCLPDKPRFVINATNVQSGALWRFSKPFMADYRVGRILNPDVELAVAVAASSAFPPFLSPVELALDPQQFVKHPAADLQKIPYTRRAVLTDGGVYDNLGLETAYKRYDTLLVSDGGGHLQDEPRPKRDWPRHTLRVLQLVDHQVRALRTRQLIGAFAAGYRKGAYWGIRTDIEGYDLPDAPTFSREEALRLAATPTRLKALDGERQERLMAWGYAACDAAMRKRVLVTPPPTLSP